MYKILHLSVHSKYIIFCQLFICFSGKVVAQQKAYWQQQTDYQIAVALNDKEHTLTGQVSLTYTNNSPDTLSFIWFHIWPNAFKNDRSAFTKQMLENGSTRFYFSDENERGYINKLNFTKDNQQCYLEQHPQHQDIIKVTFTKPILPGEKTVINTPFHVQLPQNFSRSGHKNQFYQITQWYPKPAVYDASGWHAIPYLDQGEFYAEYGKFEVSITLPDNYVVGATGTLNREKSSGNVTAAAGINDISKNDIPSSTLLKTEVYEIEHVHDFAWFAAKDFAVLSDTIQLSKGKIVKAKALYFLPNKKLWTNSIMFIKRAIQTKSEWVGMYPYETVTVVDNGATTGGGMEYPTITLIDNTTEEKDFDLLINHEIGHNWFYGILGSNERAHPWMDEGLNTYYDNRYLKEFYNSDITASFLPQHPFFKKRLPANIVGLVHEELSRRKLDQSINTSAEKFTSFNYGMYAYARAAQWFETLEQKIGKANFDLAIKNYFTQWQFKHPQPQDLKAVFTQLTDQNLNEHFNQLSEQHKPSPLNANRKVRTAFLFNFKDYEKYKTISWSPALGYNQYDKFMLGAALTNYSLPSEKLSWGIVGLYGTGSGLLNAAAHINYQIKNANNSTLRLQVNALSFTGNSYTDSIGNTTYMRFSKVVPHIQYVFPKEDARSTKEKRIDFKAFLIHEKQASFKFNSATSQLSVSYPINFRYVNQLCYTVSDKRKLYPYSLQYRVEQNKDLVRLGATGHMFFNYAKGGGLQLRAFAGKIFYLGEASLSKRFGNDAYHLNLTGPKGDEDFTFENYFVGRNKFEGFASQQIMLRDGAFKVRTDLLSNKIGKTDNWLAAINLNSSIPDRINPLSALPIKIPLKVFVDLGTYAEAWAKNANTSKLLFDAGLQVSLFKDVLNIYIPILYSKVYKDYFLSTLPDKRLLRTISFSIAFDKISFRNLAPF